MPRLHGSDDPVMQEECWRGRLQALTHVTGQPVNKRHECFQIGDYFIAGRPALPGRPRAGVRRPKSSSRRDHARVLCVTAARAAKGRLKVSRRVVSQIVGQRRRFVRLRFAAVLLMTRSLVAEGFRPFDHRDLLVLLFRRLLSCAFHGESQRKQRACFGFDGCRLGEWAGSYYRRARTRSKRRRRDSV